MEYETRGTLDASAAARSTINNIVRRVNDKLTVSVSDADCLAVSIACSLNNSDGDAIVGIILNHKRYAEASKHMQLFATSSAEWGAIFGVKSCNLSDAHVSELCNNKALLPQFASIATALRCSLAEQEAAQAWQRSASKLACYVALYTESCEDFVKKALGSLVKTDYRRLDDVRTNAEQEDTNHVLLHACVGALARSACGTLGGGV